MEIANLGGSQFPQLGSSEMPAGHSEVTVSQQLDIQLWVSGTFRPGGEMWHVISGNQVAFIWDQGWGSLSGG